MKKDRYKICLIFEGENGDFNPEDWDHPPAHMLIDFGNIEKAREYCAHYLNINFSSGILQNEMLGIYINPGEILEIISRKNFRIFLPKENEKFLEKESEKNLWKEMEKSFTDKWVFYI